MLLVLFGGGGGGGDFFLIFKTLSEIGFNVLKGDGENALL